MSTSARLGLTVTLCVLAAFAVGALLPGAFADDTSEPTAVRTALARSEQVQGAPGRTMVLSRVVVEPGAKLALHHHLGTQISRIASGTLTYTVREGSALVKEGAGQTARIRAGQWLVEQPSDIHEAANRGSSPVVIYLSTLLKSGAPPATPVAQP